MWHRLSYALALVWLLGIVLAAFIFRAAPEASQLLTITITEWSLTPAAFAAGVFATLRSVIALIVLTGAAVVLGDLVLPASLSRTTAERISFELLAGYALLGLLMLVLGLLGSFAVGWVGVVLTFGAGWRRALGWWRRLQAVWVAMMTPTEGRWLRAGVIALVIMAGVMALAPPTAWDALMYHLAGGREYVAAGGIVPLVDNYRLSLPAFAVMLYTYPQIIDAAAAPINWLMGVVTLVMLYGGVQRVPHLSEGQKSQAFWLGCVLLLAAATFQGQMSIAYADLIACAYAVAAVLLLAGERDAAHTYRLITAGAFTGVLMSARYTGVIMAVAIGVLVLWQARQAGVNEMARQAGLVVAVALVAFAPWLLKNVIIEGNPIAPYGAGGALYPASEAAFERVVFGDQLALDVLVLLPLQAAFGVEGFAPFQSSLNPVLLGALPVLLLMERERRRDIAGWLVFCGAGYVAWHAATIFSANFAIMRFIFPLLAVLSMAVAVAVVTLGRPENAFDVRRFTLGAASLSLAAGLIVAGAHFFTMQPVPVLFGLEPEEAYLERRLPAYYPAMAAVPAEGATMLLWEPRGYYCLPHCLTDDALNTWPTALEAYGSPQAVVEAWQAQGITHVLVSEQGATFMVAQGGLTEADVDALEALRGAVLYENEFYTLYTIEEQE